MENMAIVNVKYFSDLVHRNVEYNVIIPEKADVKTAKVVYLLHGLYGNSYSWMISGNAVDTAEKYNVVFVMPDGFNSFYVNHKNEHRYYDYISKEVIEHAKSIFTLSGPWYIAGLSMGGFGALLVGLNNDIFEGIGSFSGAIFPQKAIKDLEMNFLTDVYESINKEYDLLTILENKTKYNKFIYMYCGKGDSLYQMNYDFSRVLPRYCDNFIFQSDDGTHSWEMWSKRLEFFLEKIK